MRGGELIWPHADSLLLISNKLFKSLIDSLLFSFSKNTSGSSSAAAATPSGPPKCLVCSKEGKCKYNIVRNGGVQYLCDDACFKKFKQSPSSFLNKGE